MEIQLRQDRSIRQEKQEINENMTRMQNTLSRLEGKSMVSGLGTFGGFQRKADGTKNEGRFSFNNCKK